MKIRMTTRARRAVIALFAAIATLVLGAGSASAFAPLGVQYGVGLPGPNSGQVTVASGIAIGPEGQIVVADMSSVRIAVFDQDGRFLRAFGKDVSTANPGEGPEVCTTDCKAGTTGSAAGELQFIWGVAAGPDGIYVAEQGNARISVFSYEGQFLRAFGADVGGQGVDVCTSTCQPGTAGPQGGELAMPFGIALDAGGRLYVSNVGNARVEVFDAATGAFAFAFGKNVGGAGVNTCAVACQAGLTDGTPGSLGGAYGIAAGPNGEVYVTDLETRGVQVFGSAGEYRRRFGEAGAGSGQFAAPYSVAVDAQGTAYVTDLGLNRLAVFGPAGEFRAAYGRNVLPELPQGAEVCTIVCGPGEGGAGVGEFQTPMAVAADCRGAVYAGTVGRVDKWGEAGVAPAPCPEPSALPDPPAPPARPAPPAPQPAAEPSNAIGLGKLTLNRKKGTATLKVSVPGPGTLKAKAGRKMKAKAPKPKRAGTLRVKIKGKGKGVKALNRTGKLKGTLRLTYTPRGGAPNTVTRAVTLSKAPKPRR